MRSSANRIKRYYKIVAIEPTNEGYLVTLDGSPLRTPGKRQVRLPNLALAEALALEWRTQMEFIELPRMGLNALVNDAIDYVNLNRAAIIGEIAAYGGSDLLCYRAEAPSALVARQMAAWDPLLEWAQQRYSARLQVTRGILHVAQDEAAIAALKVGFKDADIFTLAALRLAVGMCGSLVLALALYEGRLDPEAAWQAAQLDEDWQRERWGEDAEATARRNNGYTALMCAGQMLRLLGR